MCLRAHAISTVKHICSCECENRMQYDAPEVVASGPFIKTDITHTQTEADRGRQTDRHLTENVRAKNTAQPPHVWFSYVLRRQPMPLSRISESNHQWVTTDMIIIIIIVLGDHNNQHFHYTMTIENDHQTENNQNNARRFAYCARCECKRTHRQ